MKRGMTNHDILNEMKNEPNFIGVFPHDKLPNHNLSGKDSLIVNYNNYNQPGSHWVAIYGNQFFDSFGIVPSDTIQDWMRKSAKLNVGEIHYNTLNLQSFVKN